MDIKFENFELLAMNLQELRTFLTIVETGSLVRASEMLNVTQSTVTARLKTLEEALGQTLLIRSKSGARLTAAGQRLHRYADTITELWQQARQEVSLPAGMSGVCNLVCDHDLWPHLGDTLFQSMKDAVPDLAISVWLGSQADIATWLDSGKADLAVTYGSAMSARQDQLVLQPDQLVLVTTSVDQAPDYVFVEGGTIFGRDHAVAFAANSSTRLSFGNATTGLDYILREGGSAYLPQRLIVPHIVDGTLFTVDNSPQFSRDIYLTYNKSARQTWDWFATVTSTLAQK
jgi:DNA-binding transcriptional LysR family regulator